MINEKKLSNSTRKLGTRQLTTVGMLSAICIILGITGYGFIPVGPVKATIMHIPVIIGAIIEGPIVGALIGLMFGLFSLINNLVNPTAASFVFWNPIVSVLPRVLIGIVSYYVYVGAIKLFKNNKISAGVGAFFGSLTNTALVLSLMYFLYADRLFEIYKVSSVKQVGSALIAVASTNGIIEAIISVLITIPIVLAIKLVKK
ncbi:ECF transporter S component [Clostridium cellulovorans]|uniref:ECF transporter S component n=1 Tax=Clostridium cellulovorans (strain ATCC 35296 / DSM 3052 / OCM 3 / 743B) TaxID=573061 RepID=D9SNP9_CLOC7|nr:ECF transporter S component [Clostridium cellulovorans]ADL49920.1 hypothetical protein Clocel_0131 [Clostridium cellulovorans 743B]